MNEDYEKLQAMINNKKLDDAEFQAKSNEVFNENYQETGIYNGYDVKEAANKDFEEISGKYLVSFAGEVPVKQKEITPKKKSSLFKKTIAALAIAATMTGAGITIADLANHPEDYVSTHPDFDGRATISEVLDRTPENFGIGGR